MFFRSKWTQLSKTQNQLMAIIKEPILVVLCWLSSYWYQQHWQDTMHAFLFVLLSSVLTEDMTLATVRSPQMLAASYTCRMPAKALWFLLQPIAFWCLLSISKQKHYNWQIAAIHLASKYYLILKSTTSQIIFEMTFKAVHSIDHYYYTTTSI